MQPEHRQDLVFAAHAVCRALDDGPVYGHDRAALLLRTAVQTILIDDLDVELGRAHADLDEARETAAALRARIEQAEQTIAQLRGANDAFTRTLPRREVAS